MGFPKVGSVFWKYTALFCKSIIADLCIDHSYVVWRSPIFEIKLWDFSTGRNMNTMQCFAYLLIPFPVVGSFSEVSLAPISTILKKENEPEITGRVILWVILILLTGIHTFQGVCLHDKKNAIDFWFKYKIYFDRLIDNLNTWFFIFSLFFTAQCLFAHKHG